MGRPKEQLSGDILKDSCNECPCFHLVVDGRRKIFRVFLEDCDGIFIPVSISQLNKVCGALSIISEHRLREASSEQTDDLARKYLGVEPVEEKYEW